MNPRILLAAFSIILAVVVEAEAVPQYLVTSSYNAGLGVIEWQVKLQKNNPAYTGAMATELPMTLSAVGSGFVTSLQSAHGDDTNGAANATWYYNETSAGSGVLLWNITDPPNPNDHTQNPGANPFTGTNTEGLYIDTANRLFFAALGSSVNMPNPVPTLHVASADGKLQWTNAIVGENGVQYTGISGMATSIIVGDMNGDGSVNAAGDLAPFQLAHASPALYQTAYPGLDYRARGDTNHDGVFNGSDVFVPEPATGVPATIGAVALGLLRRRKPQRER